LVQTQNDDWYAVFLGCQPYQANFFNTGRETFLLPVTWTADGWPVILPPQTPVPLTVKKPNLPADKPAAVPTTGNVSYTENFDPDTLAPRWTGVRVPTSKWYATSKTAKALFLEPRADRLSAQGNPSFLVVRQQNNDFSCAVTLTAQPRITNCVAGLAAFQNESHYYAIKVKIESGHPTEISLEQPAAGARGFGGRRGGSAAPPRVLVSEKLPDNLAAIRLEIEGAGPGTKCFYQAGAGARTQLGQDLQSSFLSTDTAGGFQGVMLGMFAELEPINAMPATNAIPPTINQ